MEQNNNKQKQYKKYRNFRKNGKRKPSKMRVIFALYLLWIAAHYLISSVEQLHIMINSEELKLGLT